MKNNKYTFSELVTILNHSVREKANAAMNIAGKGRKEITSIRLRPETRAYLQVHSEQLGISVSQMINIIVDGVVAQSTLNTSSVCHQPRENEKKEV